MREKLKQYKNLILVATAVILIIVLIAVDPLGFVTERRHQRAIIQNEIAVEKAETEKRIAIIKAETDAELVRIQGGVIEETDHIMAEVDTADPEVTQSPETEGTE